VGDSGPCLFAKRLENGEFVWPPIVEGALHLAPAQLALLAKGIHWRRRSTEKLDQDVEQLELLIGGVEETETQNEARAASNKTSPSGIIREHANRWGTLRTARVPRRDAGEDQRQEQLRRRHPLCNVTLDGVEKRNLTCSTTNHCGCRVFFPPSLLPRGDHSLISLVGPFDVFRRSWRISLIQ
jgi:hypothetical protein